MTRQRKYQLKHAAEGKCKLCPRKVSRENKMFCDEHREKANLRRREYKREKKAKDASHQAFLKKWEEVLPPEMMELLT